MAEYNTRPKSVIVHDPISHGAFGAFEEVDDIRSKLLFREQPNKRKFIEEYSSFLDTLSSVCEKVISLDSLIDGSQYNDLRVNPNQIYTRDSAITLPWEPGTYIQCNMGHEVRTHEPLVMSHALEELGLRKIATIEGDGYLEGGDVIPFSIGKRRVLIIGYGPRTNISAIRELSSQLIPTYIDEIIAIHLADYRINLDGGMVPITDDVMIMHKESILQANVINSKGNNEINFESFMKDLGYSIIAVTLEESRFYQACNCFCVGEREVVMYDLCPRVAEECEKLSIKIHLVPGAELVKGTGGPRCMTRPIY